MQLIEKLRLENNALRQLISYGKIYVNYESQDCDGVYGGGNAEFDSIDELYKWWEDEAESSDGPFGFSIVPPSKIQSAYSSIDELFKNFNS